MNMRKTALTVAALTALGGVWSSQAAASVYAGSTLDIQDLVIVISDDGGANPGGATIDNFNFQLTNTATLNGADAINTASCSGLPGAPGAGTNNCNPQPTNTGLNTAGTRLDAEVTNAPGGAPFSAENAFTFQGPGTDQYAFSDSVLNTSQLTGDASTDTEQMAESELQGGSTAGASAEIQSITGFTFQFTVAGANQLSLSFLADPEMLAAISDPALLAGSAQANISANFRLENDTTGDFATWSPQGDPANNCLTSFGVCTETDDDEDLNNSVGVTTDGASSAFSSAAVLSSFGILLTGLFDGDWTLTLSAVTSTSVSRTVPEPGILALLGLGLVGLAFARRRVGGGMAA